MRGKKCPSLPLPYMVYPQIHQEGDSMATTYNNLFLDTRARLKRAGVESAQLEAREIICFAADKNREQFYRDMSLYVAGEMERRVEELVQRRLAGEPVAYIIGEWEFYGLSLDVSRDVLIPRLDTELLAERGILKARESGEGARILDLCAGSGCVGLAIAANAPECRVVLGELSVQSDKITGSWHSPYGYWYFMYADIAE